MFKIANAKVLPRIQMYSTEQNFFGGGVGEQGEGENTFLFIKCFKLFID
jgi:hypothetical protein